MTALDTLAIKSIRCLSLTPIQIEFIRTGSWPEMHIKYVEHTHNFRIRPTSDSKSKTDNLIFRWQKPEYIYTNIYVGEKIKNILYSIVHSPQRVIENSASQIGAVKCRKMQFAFWLRVKCGSKDEGLSMGGGIVGSMMHSKHQLSKGVESSGVSSSQQCWCWCINIVKCINHKVIPGQQKMFLLWKLYDTWPWEIMSNSSSANQNSQQQGPLADW